MEVWIDEDDQIYVAGIESWPKAFEEAVSYLKGSGTWDSFEDFNTIQGLSEGFRAATPRWWNTTYLNENDLEVVPPDCISDVPVEGWDKVFKAGL